MTTFESKFSINEDVNFVPRYKDIKDLGIPEEFLDGKIMAVRFTEAKVLYDIYNNYWGHLFKDVPSEKVTEILKVEI